nr:S41 family peptidase [Staphylococcus canis]
MKEKTHDQDENSSKHRITFRQLILSIILTMVVTLCLTSAFFLLYINHQHHSKTQQNADKIGQVYQLIANHYYKKQDQSQLVDHAIKGMTQSLDDPYTEYLTKSETVSFNEDISGDFVGIGAEMEQKGKKIFITTPIKDSPAEKVGLKPKDELIKVNHKSIHNQDLNQVTSKVRGKKGTTVQLTIKRNNEIKTFNIKRDTVHIQSVEREAHGKTDVFKISKFQENTASELKLEIQKSLQKGHKNIILDLRNNPGGLLDEAIKMANIFLEKDQVVVELEKDGQTEKIRTSNQPLKNIDKAKISILINEGSASASEVFTGALMDHHVAKVYGETSFGKGIVQTTHEFSDGSLLKFTEMKWLTPHHRYIHNKGITPDVKIASPEYEKIKAIPDNYTAQLGDNNDYVQSIKVGLKSLGYAVNSNDASFDESLRQAITQFQGHEDIIQTGEFDNETNRKFTKKIIDKINNEDPVLKEMIQKTESS